MVTSSAIAREVLRRAQPVASPRNRFKVHSLRPFSVAATSQRQQQPQRSLQQRHSEQNQQEQPCHSSQSHASTVYDQKQCRTDTNLIPSNYRRLRRPNLHQAEPRRGFASAQPESTHNLSAEAIPGASAVSTEDVNQEEKKRTRLSEVPISEVLKAKHSSRWIDPVINSTSTLQDAVQTVIDGGLSGMMVVDEYRKVVGLITSRDLLRIQAAAIKEGETPDQIMSKVVGDYVTPIGQVIYTRPNETIGMCRSIMAKLGVKCLPVLSRDGRVEGLITARDMSDYGLTASDRGGKKNYLNDVSERVGLSSDTSMAEPPPYLQAHLALEQTPLYANMGVAKLPHPFKTPESCGSSRREFGPGEYSTDPDLSEDAYFIATADLPDEKDGKLRDVTYFGVADGVGSWREYGVDPREFAQKLMSECGNIVAEASVKGVQDGSGRKFRRVISPAEILSQAYERVKAENIIGSSTACVALVDNIRHQLHFSNLGDSGIILLRHIDSNVAGSLKRDKITPRPERKSDLRVAFVSQQQLHSFNHPYQLGWTGEQIKDEHHSFKAAKDSCTTSIHIRRGDIIIMATDGLFDNVDTEEIAEIALEWEQKNGFIRSGDVVERDQRWLNGESLTTLSSEQLPTLADRLCKIARERSLDTAVDSPFAILAKENDIMWSGGMPDDCTVIVLHVVGQPSRE